MMMTTGRSRGVALFLFVLAAVAARAASAAVVSDGEGSKY